LKVSKFLSFARLSGGRDGHLLPIREGARRQMHGTCEIFARDAALDRRVSAARAETLSTSLACSARCAPLSGAG
jgi:hypothetical protein